MGKQAWSCDLTGTPVCCFGLMASWPLGIHNVGPWDLASSQEVAGERGYQSPGSGIRRTLISSWLHHLLHRMFKGEWFASSRLPFCKSKVVELAVVRMPHPRSVPQSKACKTLNAGLDTIDILSNCYWWRRWCWHACLLMNICSGCLVWLETHTYRTACICKAKIHTLCVYHMCTTHIHMYCLVDSHFWLFCDPMDCSPSGSSVHEIFQAGILEWVAISYSRMHMYVHIYILAFHAHALMSWSWFIWIYLFQPLGSVMNVILVARSQ